MGMDHSGSSSLHAIHEESASEDDSASSGGGSSGFPFPQEYNVVTSAILIATTLPPEETLVLKTIPTILQQTVAS
jgi:hypothetical protein